MPRRHPQEASRPRCSEAPGSHPVLGKSTKASPHMETEPMRSRHLWARDERGEGADRSTSGRGPRSEAVRVQGFDHVDKGKGEA